MLINAIEQDLQRKAKEKEEVEIIKQLQLQKWSHTGRNIEPVPIGVSEGIKHDDNKPPVGLISSRAIIEEAKVMGFGCDKYDAHNWRKGISWQRLVNALLRHALAYNNGEMYDPETGISHMAHIRCCAGFLLEYEATHPELNDLTKGATP